MQEEGPVYRIFGDFPRTDGGVRLSFRETGQWTMPPALRKAVRPGGNPFDVTALLFGDELKGPALLFFSVNPGVSLPDAPAHAHASDNFRMSLRGVLPMGSERYGPGEFRLQRGWKAYASDNYANGPQGGWSVLLFGDRRGVRTRHVSADAPPHDAADQLLAEWLGITGDLTSSDPADTSGPSAISTNLGQFRGARVNSSFARAGDWPTVSPGVRSAGSLLGDPTSGPVLLLVDSDAAAATSRGQVFDTEVFHLVVSGTCSIDGVEHTAGDMRLVPAGCRVPEVVAGPDGLQEMVVLGDRRGAAVPVPTTGWPAGVGELVDGLAREITV